MKNGLLVVFEGIDGSGKTTLAHAVAERLKETFPDVLLTREPGATRLGKTLRDLILAGDICDRAEFLLFAADRAQHCAERIKPALASGNIVLSDRMSDSSLIYQGISHGFIASELRSINNWAMNGVTPDLTFYLRISASDAHTRLVARGPLTKFETIEQLAQAAAGFDELYANAANVYTLNATDSTDKLVEQTTKLITSYAEKLCCQ